MVFSIKEFSDFFELTQTRKEKLDEALFNLKNKEYTINYYIIFFFFFRINYTNGIRIYNIANIKTIPC